MVILSAQVRRGKDGSYELNRISDGLDSEMEAEDGRDPA